MMGKIMAVQEQGYPIMVMAAGCHQKKNGNMECTTDDTDPSGLIMDNENRTLRMMDGYFSPGDTLNLQFILRPYDPDKDDKNHVKKPKKCKKGDACVYANICIVD